MYCKNCGNEVTKNEKFCGKCGTKVDDYNLDEPIQIEEKQDNKKQPIKIKFTHFIIGIVVILLLPTCVVFMKNSSGVIKSAESTNQGYKENILPTNINSISKEKDTNKILDVIDTEKNEIKINAMELVNAMIDIKNELDDKERNIPNPLVYVKENSNNNGEEVISYKVGYKTLNSPVYFIISSASTNNIYRIAVYYPYKNSYGTELNNSAIENYYNILGQALTRLNHKEVYDTILDVKDYVGNHFDDGTITPDWNIRGISFTQVDGEKNVYGTISGFYNIYGTK